jgi:cytochrome c oxidase subunit III
MPGTTILDDIELIIEDIGGGGGKKPPERGDDGDRGDGDKRRRPAPPSQRRFATAILLALVSILVLFLTLSVAFIVLKLTSPVWASVRLPRILWLNTAILIASSLTLELARRRLRDFDLARFRILWRTTLVLGLLFVAGQVIAWWQLVRAGVYIASNQAISFFYIFTAAHALHLLGGIAALLYVALRRFETAKVSRGIAAQVTSYYWHFMDGLWVFLLALLYLVK